MPSVQRGSVVKRGNRWGARWYDEMGARRFQGGFATKTAAREWLDDRVKGVAALRRGDSLAVAESYEVTFAELVERFLAQHDADNVTIARLRSQLKAATAVFGERPIRTLRPDELAAWRKNITNRHHVFRAVKQVLAQAERWKWLDENPARYIKNPKPRAPEIQPFTSWAEMEAAAEEIDPRFAAIPLFAAGTGLRPEEWIALERTSTSTARTVSRSAGSSHRAG
jgi:integrase